MIKTKYLNLLLIICFYMFMPNIVPAQADSSGIGAGIGISFTGYYDEIDSQISRHSHPLTYFLNGYIEKNYLLHLFNAGFFWGEAKRQAPYRGYNHVQCSSIRGYLDYSLSYRLFKNHFYSPYIGGAMRALIHYTGPVNEAGFDKLHPSGVVLFSFDLNLGQKFIINDRHSFFLSLRLPFFGYAVRPPYAGLDGLWIKYLHEGTYSKFLTLGEAISFHNYNAISGDLKYNFKINNRFSVYSGMEFEYSLIKFYRPRKDIIFTLNGGFTFLFKEREKK